MPATPAAAATRARRRASPRAGLCGVAPHRHRRRHEHRQHQQAAEPLHRHRQRGGEQRTGAPGARAPARARAAAAPAGSNATAVSGRCSATSDGAARARPGSPRRPGRASPTPSGSPNSSSSRRGGASGRQRQQRRRARTCPVTTTAVAVSEPIRSSRAGERHQRRGHGHAGAGAQQQRHARQRGQHQAGQQPVGQRLRGIAQAVARRPRTTARRRSRRAARPRRSHGGRCPSATGRAGGPAGPSVLVVLDGDRPQRPAVAPEHHDLAAVGLPPAPRAASVSAGGPKATWRRLRQSTRSNRARAVHVVGGHQQRAALGAQLGEQRRDRLRAGGIDARPAARRAAARGRPRPARGRCSTLWRWPPESSPKRRARLRRPAPPARGPRARPRGRARAAGSHQRPLRERAHQRHVERADREVQPGALGLRHVGRARGHSRPSPPAAASSPSSARNSVVLPPPLGPSTHTAVPGPASKLDPGEHRARPVAHATGPCAATALTADALATAATAVGGARPTTATAGPGGTSSHSDTYSPSAPCTAADAHGAAPRAPRTLPANEPGDGGGHHEDRGHEQRAHRGQRGHRGEGHQRQQREVRALGGEPQPRRADGSKATAVQARPSSATPARARARRRRRRRRCRRPPRPMAVPNSSRSTDAPGLEDVAGQDHAAAQRGHQQEAGGGVAGIAPGAARALGPAGVSERHGQRGDAGAEGRPPAPPPSPGNVAVPTAWAKNAIRRSTMNAPSSPPATASRESSNSAVRVLRSSSSSAGLGREAMSTHQERK